MWFTLFWSDHSCFWLVKFRKAHRIIHSRMFRMIYIVLIVISTFDRHHAHLKCDPSPAPSHHISQWLSWHAIDGHVSSSMSKSNFMNESTGQWCRSVESRESQARRMWKKVGLIRKGGGKDCGRSETLETGHEMSAIKSRNQEIGEWEGRRIWRRVGRSRIKPAKGSRKVGETHRWWTNFDEEIDEIGGMEKLKKLKESRRSQKSKEAWKKSRNVVQRSIDRAARVLRASNNGHNLIGAQKSK
jgi:hypothetical protein